MHLGVLENVLWQQYAQVLILVFCCAVAGRCGDCVIEHCVER
jgi:hypothetical protein